MQYILNNKIQKKKYKSKKKRVLLHLLVYFDTVFNEWTIVYDRLDKFYYSTTITLFMYEKKNI